MDFVICIIIGVIIGSIIPVKKKCEDKNKEAENEKE